jgi:alkylation response protein AidB-like acyl-CoA dehydrogenase
MSFYTDVRVADLYRIGEVNGGWDVMQTALVHERAGKGRGAADRLLGYALEWASQPNALGEVPMNDPVVRLELARVATRNEVAKLLGYKAGWAAAKEAMTGPIGSMGKLFASESYVRAAAALLDLLGPEGVLSGDDAAVGGWIEHAHRKAAVTTIYQGTSEIQRSIIAERGLGLPRSRGK